MTRKTDTDFSLNDALPYEQLKGLVSYLRQEEQDKVYQAYLLADAAHVGQYRRSGEPYITHPTAVACILATMRMDYETILSGLLHDVLEDTPTTKAIIRQKFGESVADIVDGVSKLSYIQFQDKVEAQAENFRKMLLAMAKDIRVIIVKLADRLHNMQTIDHLSKVKQKRIAKETLEIFAPIAKRMGMHKLSQELEDLGFKIFHPIRYQVLANSLKKVHGSHSQVIQDICNKIKQQLTTAKIDFFEVEGREKHIYSIYKKMKNKRLPFTDLTDVYAIRIIVEDIDHCYRALGVTHQLYKPMMQKFKDYIGLPKANGYQSIHTVLFGPYGVPVELQIRTRKMDQMASGGVAAHWLYKSSNSDLSIPQVQTQQWLTDLVEMQQKTGSSLEFIENVKVDLFPDEVYIFTPKGKIVELPVGATSIDLAYNIHTDIGNNCVAAKIDRQFAPLSTPLTSGQTVEIITHPQAHPSHQWLDFVVTGKARSAIRHRLKTEQKHASIKLGFRLISRSLEECHLNIEDISEDAKHQAAVLLGFVDFDELLEDIGLGNRSAFLVCQQCFVETDSTKLTKIAEKKPLYISGTEGMAVKFAECCCPIPGDKVVATIDSGKGLLVHRQQCSKFNAKKKARDKTIWVQWSSTIEGEFVVHVKVDVVNQRGTLAMIALAVSDARANIEDLHILSQDQKYASIRLDLKVTGRQQLAQVIRKIRRIKQMIKCVREMDSAE
ncbi:MAG TPA: RelA/SpoT family protein [Gammaproteobacteria bacterium]|nr:RelA/SpoT family protein [Gammaproteobacteria bacterium]